MKTESFFSEIPTSNFITILKTYIGLVVYLNFLLSFRNIMSNK